MAMLNKIMLIGRLTANPDAARFLERSNSYVVKFRFAVGRSRKNPQTGQWENDPNPLYIDCEAYSRADNTKLTDLISRYCQKGSQIYLEGRLQLDTWDDKDNPSLKRSKHKVVVDSIQFLDTRQGDDGSSDMGGDSSNTGGNFGRQNSPPPRSGNTNSGSGFSGGLHDDVPGGGGMSDNDSDIPF